MNPHILHSHVESYLVVIDYLELLAIWPSNVHQLHPQVLIPANPTMLKASQPIVQIVLDVAVTPRQGYHHQMDRV